MAHIKDPVVAKNTYCKPKPRKNTNIGNCKNCIYYNIDNTDYTIAKMTDNKFNFYYNKRKELITYIPEYKIICTYNLNPKKEVS